MTTTTIGRAAVTAPTFTSNDPDEFDRRVRAALTEQANQERPGWHDAVVRHDTFVEYLFGTLHKPWCLCGWAGQPVLTPTDAEAQSFRHKDEKQVGGWLAVPVFAEYPKLYLGPGDKPHSCADDPDCLIVGEHDNGSAVYSCHLNQTAIPYLAGAIK